MTFNSIRVRLQLWYGVILVVILAGFGLTAWQLERGQLLGRINGQLDRRAGFLATAMQSAILFSRRSRSNWAFKAKESAS